MTTTVTGSNWLSTNDLAQILGIDSSSLRRWRTAKPPQGPPFVKLSPRRTIYDARDVERWLRDQRTDPRSST